MKKLFSILFLVCIVSMLAIAEKTVAVATFDVVGNAVSKDEAETITELYIAELVATGKVVVTDRANFSKLLAELKFQGSDWSDSEKTIKLGNALNANVISRGKIMKLGNKLYISATLIEAKTAKVLSSSKAEITDLGEAPNVLVGFAKNVIEGLSLKIGDIGPGGGLIFYIEGNKALECSELLGEANWEGAKRMCAEYCGGGYDDWYLPTKEELNWIYENLKGNLFIGTCIRKCNVSGASPLRREVIYSGAVAYASATCQFLEVYPITSKTSICFLQSFLIFFKRAYKYSKTIIFFHSFLPSSTMLHACYT